MSFAMLAMSTRLRDVLPSFPFFFFFVDCCMFTRTVQVDSAKVLLFDGRASPMKSTGGVHCVDVTRPVSAECGSGTDDQGASEDAAVCVTCSPVQCSGESPLPRWRHTITPCMVGGMWWRTALFLLLQFLGW